MPIDYSRYPSDWKTKIRPRILERAGHKCEWCGVENHATILRSVKDGSRYLVVDDDYIHYTPDGTPTRLSEMPEEFDAQTRYTKVVLTIAHLGVDKPDGTPGDKHDKMDCRDENLAALCQRCHLTYDMDEHVANRRETLRKRRIQKRREHDERTGQLRMFE